MSSGRFQELSGNRRDRLTQEEFQAIREFLYRHTGIVLADNKRYLVESRLRDLLQSHSTSFSQWISYLRADTLPAEFRTRLIEALTTNETFWFRDAQQFELLQNQLLPKLSHRRPIRIWSAACATGQEPYSIGICVHEARRLKPGLKVEVQILGTDLAGSALQIAKQAVYSDLATARGLSPELKQRYFLPHPNGWQLKPEVRRLVSFQQLNLLDSFAALGQFDLIFCRNVLIYFSPELRRQILERLAELLLPHGYLFLSSTESLPPGLNRLSPVIAHGVRYYVRNA
ncbi:protein-glutamate O-methyltransferase CheR [Methylothermus subterraneus]